MGLGCKRRKCPRCAAEKLLKERMQPVVGVAKLDVRESVGFVEFFGLT